ncbi:MAG: class I SAM-dependent RNA methyltransferase [Chloroflexi bacterium]|nr:MAG: class I SAM-dependent RNA methyltransferase [Chloroflexota bacterium]TMG11379.1 MAG: class I SAM-dependent RNA methyltransferase [Chloroflexota bacterium]
MAPLILRPSSPAHGGAAVARDDGKVWLVNYALPGEVVEAEPRGRQGGVAVAAATRVIEASPHRVAAPCPYFGACGGCQLQHASYAHQLELKRQVVEEAWARAGLRLPPDTAVLGMDDPWRYRIRGEFEAVAGAGGWRFGFHRLRSHSVLPIDSCVIHDARIESALPAFAQAANELQLTGLQNLLLTAEPTGSGLLWRLRFHGREPRWPRDDFAHRVAELLPGSTLLDEAMTLEFWNMTFRVRSDTFLQTNYKQMLVLYQVALDMLQTKSEERILDLYAGIGTISVAVARSGAAVTAIEENPHAVQLGRLNARINSARVEYLPGKVETVLRAIRLGQHQAVILDPPRAGCEPAALAELIRLGLDRLVYVSCEPSTHARDLVGLVRGGYRVRRAAIVDMFPQTYHIESVAMLERS